MMNCCCGSSLKFLGVLLLVGCCTSAAVAENGQNSDQPTGPTGLRMASMIHSYDLHEQNAASSTPTTGPIEVLKQDKYWAFPSEDASETVLHLPAVVRLPSASTAEASTAEAPSESSEESPGHQHIARLLPPQAIVAPPATIDENFTDIHELLAADPQESDQNIEHQNSNTENSTNDLSTEEQEIVDAVIRDSRAVTTGVMTESRVNEIAKQKIRHGYALANRGAYYAARQELIEVLRMISQHNDAHQGEAKHTLALAAGLRALEEADDFAPRGTQLEADLVIDVICASHRTPVARQLKSSKILPPQMMDCYFRYAQLKLAAAVKDEPAGSMALHALGKLTSRLNKVEPEKLRLAHRRAVAYQQAALLAHNQNHLAAHELAVLLADSGHYVEAEQLLIQVIPREPNAIVYRNLARVQEKMGQTQNAVANRNYAHQLIRQGAGGLSNVQWVSPQNFARTGGSPTRFASAATLPPVTQTAAPPQQFPRTTNTNWR